MLSNSFLWNGLHPRLYLPQDYHIYLAQDGITELEGPGWESKQNWIMTFIDPCGLTAMLVAMTDKKPKEKPFWENNGFEHIPLVRNGDSGSV